MNSSTNMGNVLHKEGSQEAEAEAEPEELEVNSEFTCEICVEPVQSTKKFSNNTLCRHPFCIDCIAKYIEARLADGAPTTIKCPALNCNHQLDPLFCRSVIPKDLFIQWCDRLCDTAILEVDKSYCPNRNCSMLVLNECGGTVKKASCPNCKMTFCFQCKVPWHAGYWCSESGQSRDRNDVLLGMMVELNHWIRCYKCGHAIEKIQGCMEVRCRCGSILCYKCGRPYHPQTYCEHERGRIPSWILSCALALVWIFVLVVGLIVKSEYDHLKSHK